MTPPPRLAPRVAAAPPGARVARGGQAALRWRTFLATPAMTPAPRAVVVLAVLALSALLLPLGVVALAVLALAAAVFVDARAARRRPEVERRVPEVLSRGVPAELRVRAPAPAGGSVRVRQAAPAALALEHREGDGELRSEVVARRRGRHVLPAVATRVDRPARPRALGSPGRRGRPRCASSRTCAPRAGWRWPSPAGASATRARRRAGRSAWARSSS